MLAIWTSEILSLSFSLSLSVSSEVHCVSGCPRIKAASALYSAMALQPFCIWPSHEHGTLYVADWLNEGSVELSLFPVLAHVQSTLLQSGAHSAGRHVPSQPSNAYSFRAAHRQPTLQQIPARSCRS